jgi:transcriptional regulator with XRE-family HTH domain
VTTESVTTAAHPLRERRRELELRQADVASEAGVSVAFISMLESGYRPRSPVNLERVALAVGASVGSFW